jgi:hypothetical protein
VRVGIGMIGGAWTSSRRPTTWASTAPPMLPGATPIGFRSRWTSRGTSRSPSDPAWPRAETPQLRAHRRSIDAGATTVIYLVKNFRRNADDVDGFLDWLISLKNQ